MSEPRDLDSLDLDVDDPRATLRAIAGSGARVRAAELASRAAGLGDTAERARSFVVAGAGAVAVAAVVRAVAGPTCPVPVLDHEAGTLPGYVGALDVVVVLSRWPFDLAAAVAVEDAGRRGARVLVVGPAETPVAEALGRARGEFVELPRGPVSWWSLLIPVLRAAAGARVLSLGAEEVEAAATRLDAVAITCRPDADVFSNPAKALGSSLSEATPVLWGTSEVTAAAALHGRAALLELAGITGLAGTLPEPGDPALNALVKAGTPSTGDELEDLFRDRLDDDGGRPGVVVVLLRDPQEAPTAAARAEVVARVAGEQHHPVHVIAAAGDSRLERLASVAGLLELAAGYAALAAGREPGDPSVTDEIGGRLRR